MHMLMLPFKWVHLLSPVLPNSLIDILDAPVPILVGISGNTPPKGRYPDIIWVDLGEQDLSKTISADEDLKSEVFLPLSLYNSQELRDNYAVFSNSSSMFDIQKQ